MQVINFRDLSKKYLSIIENSFLLANQGKENLKIVLWCWGAPSYIFSYFVIDNFIKWNPVKFIDIILSMISVIYFAWHIRIIKKCSPKPTPPIKEESEQKKKELAKKIFRKIFLKEPIWGWKTEKVFIVLDIFSICVYLTYIFE